MVDSHNFAMQDWCEVFVISYYSSLLPRVINLMEILVSEVVGWNLNHGSLNTSHHEMNVQFIC